MSAEIHVCVPGTLVLGVDRFYKALTSLIEFPQSQKYISLTHFLDPGSQGTGTNHATTFKDSACELDGLVSISLKDIKLDNFFA